MPPPEIALDAMALDELNGPEARALFDTIDSLRELGVGEIVNLPQIIVVGDQSSGKSSVLESISRVRFPAKGDLCTRFATELVLQRSPETKIVVRIDRPTKPGSDSSEQFHRTSFDKDSLVELINEAAKKMGIRDGGSKCFSKNVLHVEIASPDTYPLTLVDLPGFYHSETSDQAQEGKDIVKQLAKRYMRQPESIILTVVSANHNLANQIVVEEAKKYDPSRQRTLGIITKPDLAGPGSQDEKKCLQLVRGQESMHRLELGWHVLRNLPEGREGERAEVRDAEEESFFRTGTWSSIASKSRGASQLRKKLSQVLQQHIQRTLPDLIEEIKSQLSNRQQILEQLGRPLTEPNEQRTYLLEIADQFQRLARDGVEGRYGDEFFGPVSDDDRGRKLRALLRKLNRAFYVILNSKGVDRKVERDDEGDDDDDDDDDNDGDEGDEDDEESQSDDGPGLDWTDDGVDEPEYLESFTLLFDEFVYPDTVSESILREELEEWAAATQGTEFPGLPNANLGFQLFKMQAKPWAGIAQCYLDQSIKFAKAFVENIFVHIIGPNKQITNAVLVFCVSGFFEDKRRALKQKLQEILRPYTSAYGPPLDAHFHAMLSSRSSHQQAARVASLLKEKFPAAFTERGGRCLTHKKVLQAISKAERARVSEFGTEKTIDMAMTHFRVRIQAAPILYALTQC